MIRSPLSLPRHMLPRWRSLDRTLASNELSAAHQPSAVQSLPLDTAEVAHRLAEWSRTPSLVTASELVEASIVYGVERVSAQAAQEIVNPNSNATPLVKINAEKVIQRVGEMSAKAALIIPRISARRHTQLHPENPLAWVELALAQVGASATDAALKTMRVALKLAPENRHVLRSAARLYIHVHQPDRAHDLVKAAEITPDDPWLIAAEISTAAQAERRPRFLKRGLLVVSDQLRAPRQLTELAGALGTSFLSDGDRRRGKKLIKQSLTDPNGNSLAQAEWVAREYSEAFIETQRLRSQSDASEALTARYFELGDFKLSAFFAKEWMEEETFSSRAYGAASVAFATLEDFEKAEIYARNGLKRDPTSSSLSNSLIFSLAELNRLDEAETYLSDLEKRGSDSEGQRAVADANKGLIALKRGKTAAAVEYYRAAINTFVRLGHREVENLARAYFARQAVAAGLTDAHGILLEAESKAKSFTTAHSRHILHIAHQKFARKQGESGESQQT